MSKEAARIKRLKSEIEANQPPFYEEGDTKYALLHEKHFPGFRKISAGWISDTEHANIHKALETLQKAEYFSPQFMIKDGALARVNALRMTIGDEGQTWFYNNLRVFGHPWSCSSEEPYFEKSADISNAMAVIKRLNDAMQARENSFSVSKKSSCPGFNMALINLYDDKTATSEEPYFGMGPVLLPWHQDKGIVPGTTIAGYTVLSPSSTSLENVTDEASTTSNSLMQDQTMKRSRSRNDTGVPWRIGLKLAWDTHSPAITCQTDAGEAYFMLGDFNHTHRHCVLAGHGLRMSSTHRVAVSEGNTWTFIQGLAMEVLAKSVDDLLADKRGDQLREVERVHTVIECEWIRPFYFRGSRHRDRHTYWSVRIEQLEQYWSLLEDRIQKCCKALVNTRRSAVAKVLVSELQSREAKRTKWMTWYADAQNLSSRPNDIPIIKPDIQYSLKDMIDCLHTMIHN